MFDFRHLGLEKVKHTIEPEVRYFFVPAVGRPIFDTRLPACSTLAARGQRTQPGSNCDATLFSEGYLFDERDAVNQRNFFSYGVTSRLLGRGASTAEIAAREEEGVAEEEVGPSASGPVDPDILPQGLSANALPSFVGPPAPRGGAGVPAVPAARELVRASILHGYDVSRELVAASHQSDVDLGLRVTPLDYLGLSYNTTVSLADSVVRGLSVGGFVREPWWQATPGTRSFQSPSTLGISYRFIEKNVNQGVGPDSGDSRLLASNGVNELDGSLYLRLGDYLGFTYLSRYDLGTTPTTGPHFPERDYLLRIISRCNCWLVEAGVADKTNPDERLFRVQLTLVGLGSFGRSPQNRNYVGFNPLAGLGFRTPASSATGGLY